MPRKISAVKSLPGGVITAMFTDIVDSTRVKSLMEGETSARRDTQYRRLIKEPHDAIVLAAVAQSGGYIVNPTGDGFCITFVDAEEAVLCGLRIQQHLRENPIETALGPLQIRIGLHTGMADPSGDDYIASTIDKTARIQGKASGGEVFVSQQTQVLVSVHAQGVRFEPRGIFDLKGLQAEQLYQVIPDVRISPIDFGASDSRALASTGGNLQQGAAAKPQILVWAGAGVLVVGLALLTGWKLGVDPQDSISPTATPQTIIKATSTPETTSEATLKATPRATAKPTPSPTDLPVLLPQATASPEPTSAEELTPTEEPSPVPTPRATKAEKPIAQHSTTVLPVGSQWDGSFQFLPPMSTYGGSVSIHINHRKGNTFDGTYASEQASYEWLIEGTIKGDELHWTYLKSLKNPGTEDAVGKAYGVATVDGKKMTGFFRTYADKNEVARLELFGTG